MIERLFACHQIKNICLVDRYIIGELYRLMQKKKCDNDLMIIRLI
jgi:hypothetical protein